MFTSTLDFLHISVKVLFIYRQCIDQKKVQKDKNKSRQKQQHKKEEIEQYESH
jgi:hypothetical protein